MRKFDVFRTAIDADHDEWLGSVVCIDREEACSTVLDFYAGEHADADVYAVDAAVVARVEAFVAGSEVA